MKIYELGQMCYDKTLFQKIYADGTKSDIREFTGGSYVYEDTLTEEGELAFKTFKAIDVEYVQLYIYKELVIEEVKE